MDTASWLSLFPPLLVLIIAGFTHNVLPALWIGIITAAAIATQSLWPTFALTAQRSLEQLLLTDNLKIFAFLLALGIFIALLNMTGSTYAYSKLVQKKVHTPRQAELASILLSGLLAFDDFFSSITVGSIMQSLTDKFYIPRAKLAFLIDTMAAPLVILVPISSWIATLTMQLSKAGISPHECASTLVVADPLAVYMELIPFIFYSIIMVSTALYIVIGRISYGPMYHQEQIAQTQGNLFGGKVPRIVPHTQYHSGSLSGFFIPIIILLSSISCILLYTGNYVLLGGINSFLQALYSADVFGALSVGTGATVVATFCFLLMKKYIKIQNIGSIVLHGIHLMGPSCLILLSAWIFSSILSLDLHSGTYLAQLIVGGGKFIITALPVLFFIVSAIISIAIGSSWGTIAVLVPLVVPMTISLLQLSAPITLDQAPLLFSLLGATFAGAVAGDHISPISSTTIMSSTSSGAYHKDHVRTQLVYALPVFIATCIAYGLAGFFAVRYQITGIIALPLGILISCCLTTLFHQRQHRKKYRSIKNFAS